VIAKKILEAVDRLEHQREVDMTGLELKMLPRKMENYNKAQCDRIKVQAALAGAKLKGRPTA